MRGGPAWFAGPVSVPFEVRRLPDSQGPKETKCQKVMEVSHSIGWNGSTHGRWIDLGQLRRGFTQYPLYAPSYEIDHHAGGQKDGHKDAI